MAGTGAACAGAFKVLRAMVSNWFGDVQSNANVFADALLIHFYRWLCSPKSTLYDPSLHRFVHSE